MLRAPMAPSFHSNLAAVRGISVGHWTDLERATGCSVVLGPDGGMRAACAVRGRATGTRELEQWLAREVAVRTRDLEERTTVVEDIALAALAAAGDWPGASDAVEKLAKELGTSPDDVTREIQKRRGAGG